MKMSTWLLAFVSFSVGILLADILGVSLSILCGLGRSPKCAEWVDAALRYSSDEWSGFSSYSSYTRAALGAAVFAVIQSKLVRGTEGRDS